MAGSNKIDTGTGGFPIEGDAYSYDTGTENDQYWQKPSKWNSGDINIDQVQKDLAAPIKRTLATYLSNTTLGKTPSSPSSVANSYPISHNVSQDPSNLRLTDEQGYAAPLKEPDLSQERFEYLWTQNYSRSKAVKIRRGRERPTEDSQIDGNSLLKNVTPPNLHNPAFASGEGFSPDIKTVDISTKDGNKPILDYYGSSKDLSNSMIYNRFNPDLRFGPYVAPGTHTRGGELDQYSLGSTNSKELHRITKQFENPSRYEFGKSVPATKPRVISYGTLAQIGVALSMRASGELNSLDEAYNPSNGASAAIAQLPGTAQLGTTLNRTFLNADDVIMKLDYNETIPQESLIDPASKSWGTLNNVNDEFTGVSSIGMQFLTAALLLSVTVSMGALSILFSSSGGEKPKKKDSKGRYFPGNFYVKYPPDNKKPDTSSIGGMISAITSGDILTLLGIEKTNNSFQDCLISGLLLNFGVASYSGVSIPGLSDIAKAASSSPGYYAVMARALNRSILKIADTFVGLGKAFANILTNPINAVKQLLSIFEVLKESKFFRVANTFAKLGDKWLSSLAETIKANIASIRVDPSISTQRLGELSEYSDSSLGNVRSWAAHRASDFLLFPKSIIRPTTSIYEAFGIPKSLPTARTLKNKSIYLGGGNENRISTEEREMIEDSLESEYVPFYIHDVRTNEIVSFHAFLASLNDSYSAQYDTVDGIGRVEGAKIYKSTARKLDFSFWIVSTSPEDFDSMWLKINKLTTLVYPQFSKGRTIQDENNKLYAPFSQLVQASPLVRVRIGDLIKSNYSKFNLARLFGYSYEDTQLENKRLSKYIDDFAYKIAEKQKKFISDPIGKKFYYTGDFIGTFGLSEFLNDAARFPSRAFAIKIIKKMDNLGSDSYAAEIIESPEDGFNGLTEEQISTQKKYLEQWKLEALGKKGFIRTSQLLITEKDKKEIHNQVIAEVGLSPSSEERTATSTSQNYDDIAKSFMSDDPKKGNVVTRSFRSAGGKGIAGFIESLSFEWPTDKQWEIGRGIEDPQSALGRRAPYVCKVSVGFSPIHDITPGLDHIGANRAPIYPVGPLSFNDLYSKTRKSK